MLFSIQVGSMRFVCSASEMARAWALAVLSLTPNAALTPQTVSQPRVPTLAKGHLGRKRRSCVANHLLRVRLTERALCLSDCASDVSIRLS
jgi:hypothetical protein